MATQIEVARQLVQHAAALKDAGRPCLKEAAMAQALRQRDGRARLQRRRSRSTAATATSADFPVERIYRDVRVCQIYEGTSDVQKMLIGRALA